MRCTDCLPLLEEYFDGEVEGQTAEQVAAHLAKCADCSAALDALSFEQEVYARYDRGGLEVGPDLWARVSAEIARTPHAPESPAAARPFLSRARAYFAAVTATLAARPALASSMALLVLAAALGTLWLSRRTPQPVSNEVAVRSTPATVVSSGVPQASVDNGGGHVAPAVNDPLGRNKNEVVPVVYEPRGGEREAVAAPNVGGSAQTDLAELLRDAPALKDEGIVRFRQEPVHVDDTEALFVNTSGPAGDVIASNTRPLDPEQKDLARHVERAQMLLRSIKNVRASDLADSDISYEKKLSRKLLAENATLQLEAEVKGDKETKQVLDRIEPFLLDIANMGDKPSSEEVRSIRERVKQNEIVAALEVY